MSDGRLDRSPTHQQKAGASVSYAVRRMRNTAVLVKWIEEHQSNPYPTKAEKQYLAYYSGMNLTQLSTWFANARRRIKKIGMKTWLEGRSTFTVDFGFQTRPAIQTDGYAGTSYSTTTPYPYTSLPYSPLVQHTSPTGLPSSSPRLPNGGASTVSYTIPSAIQQNTYTSVASMNGLYGSGIQPRSSFAQPMMAAIGMHHWSATPLLPTTSMALQSRQGRHSPITAQVYTPDLRTHSTQSLEACDGAYSLPQHSPDQIIPECASSEPNTA